MHRRHSAHVIILFLVTFLATVAKANDKPIVRLDTSLGLIFVELEHEKAPKTVANFLSYVEEGFYNGLIFHRVIPNFMIQGGGLDPAMKKRATRAPIRNEAKNGLANVRGTLAMARTSDPHSATAQFFINLVDNDFLNRSKARDGWGYCVFGRVVKGMDIVDKIQRVGTATIRGRRDVPRKPIFISRAQRVNIQSNSKE